MFRLLAYGGTSFTERRRFGSWTVPESTLGDYYGVAAGEICVGLGIESGSAALIYRDRQHLENRGGYPYTLLFDPGREVWERFGWSASDLLLALQSDITGRALFAAVDDVTESDLQHLVTRLVRTALGGEPPAARLSIFGAALAGSVEAPDAVVISPSYLGWDRRPGPAAIAAMIGRDAGPPVLARTGLGWLIGGSLVHAGPFGVRLVVDDQSPPSADSALPCLTAGERVLAGWQYVRQRWPDALRKVDDTPPWLWSMPPREALSRIGIAAALLIGEVDQDLFAEARRFAAEGGFLAKEIRQHVRSRRGGMQRERALLLLDEVWAGRGRVDVDADLSHVDRVWLARELRERGIPPGAPPPDLRLSAAFHERLWLEWLAGADRAERIGRLGAAASQLLCREFDADGSQGQANSNTPEPVHLRLVAAAVPDDPSPVEQDALEAYRHEPIWPAIVERLRPVLRAQATQPELQPLAYVRYAGDPDLSVLEGAWKSDSDAPARAEAFIRTCLDHVQIPGMEATLEAIASSPFRALLSIRLKRQLGESIGRVDAEHRWTPFLVLCALYEGADLEPPPVGEHERARLLEELRALLEFRPVSPNAPVLNDWLGPLPQSLAKPLYEAWGRSRLAAPPLDVPSRRIIPVSHQDWKPAVLAALFTWGDPKALRQMLNRAHFDTALRDAVRSALMGATSEEGQGLMAWLDADLIRALIEAAPDRTDLIVGWPGSDTLLAVFGQEIRSAFSPPRAAVFLSDGAWAAVQHVRAHPMLRDQWLKQLWGTDASKMREWFTTADRERPK